MFPNYLEQSDIDILANLLLRSQQSRAREILCRRIGIDPNQLVFIRDSSDTDFVTQLIYYLDDVGDKEALCKLCCQELLPIFNKSTYKSILEEIAVKLNCNHDFGQNSPNNKILEQSSSLKPSSVPQFGVNYPNQLDESKPESLFTKIGKINKKLLAGGGAIILIALAGYPAYEYLKQRPQELDGVCADPWVTGAVRSVMGRVPIGTGDRGECNKLLYNNGHWNNYDELLGAVNKSVNSYTEGVCRDPWITDAVSQVMKRPPKGKGELGECNMYNYGGGSWNDDYNQLLVHVRAALGK